ncbi:MAG: DUF4139 domain-containing protein, partial [Bacteroidia bacterium]
ELTALRMEQIAHGKKRTEIKVEYDKLYNQLVNHRVDNQVHTGEAVLTISAPRDMTAPIELTYYVEKAGWTPFYDFRVKNITSPLNVSYKAYVLQTSGEDWKEVKLVLSSGNPKQSSVMPYLRKWNLQGYTYRRVNNRGETVPDMYDKDPDTPEGTRVDVSGRPLDSDDDGYPDSQDREPFSPKDAPVDNNGVALTQDLETRLQSEILAKQSKQEGEKKMIDIPVTKSDAPTVFNYEIDIPYTIMADGKAQLVEIKQQEIPAEYQYYAIPKLDEAAYLLALIRNWEKYDLLEGQVNLFLEGMFLGTSQLSLKNANDTLKVSLGQDKRIIVNYTQLRQFKEKKFLSGAQISSRAYQISVRNLQNTPINIVLEDQFPTSTQKEVEVIQEEKSGGKVNADNKVKWELDLKPNEEKKLQLKYSVKYPTNWGLQGDL